MRSQTVLLKTNGKFMRAVRRTRGVSTSLVTAVPHIVPRSSDCAMSFCDRSDPLSRFSKPLTPMADEKRRQAGCYALSWSAAQASHAWSFAVIKSCPKAFRMPNEHVFPCADDRKG